MIDHDRLFKELISTFFFEFVDLFLPEVSTYLEPGSWELLDKELFTDVTAGQRYEADLVVKARFRDQDSYFLIHTEHQGRSESQFGQRMFSYFAHLHEKYGLPVYPVVIFSHNSPKRSEPDFYRVEFPNKRILEFNYEVIQLNRLNWRDFIDRPNPVASALMAKMNIVRADRPKVKKECLRLLATLRLDPARMQLISGFIDTYLRLNAAEEEVFRQELATIEPEAQEEIMQIVTSWMEQGIQQGKREQAEAFVIRLTARRLGTVSPQLQERIQRLSIAQLEELGEALFDLTDLAALTTWLDEQEQQQN